MLRRRYFVVFWLLLSSGSALSNTGDVAPLGAPNGLIDSGDAVVALQMAQGMIPPDMNADVWPLSAPDGVVDTNDVVAITQSALGSLTIPELTLQEAVEAGLEAIRNQRFIGANHLFDTAVGKINEFSLVNDVDTAYFFRAMTRLLAALVDIVSDREPSNGLQRIADLVDAFGCLPMPRNDWETLDCLHDLPADSPNGTDIQAYFSGPVTDLFTASLIDLALVSQWFNRNWQEDGDSFGVESDYGDVLFLEGAFNAALSLIAYFDSLDMNGDIDQEANAHVTVQQLLIDLPDLVSLNDTAKLTESASRLDESMVKLIAAIDFMQLEADLQHDDFINLADSTPERIAITRSEFASVRSSITGTPASATDNGVPFTVTLSNFFSGLSLRQELPPYTGDIPGFFPDPGFDNVIGGSLNVNEDINGDGIPDILQ